MKKLFTLIWVFLATISFGQEFQLLDDYLQSLSATEKNATLGSTSKASSVKQLLFDLQPTLILSNQKVSVVGSEDPLVLRTDFASLASMSSISNLKSVKAIVINLANEPNSTAMLGQQLKQLLPGLQYVFVNCEYNTSGAALKQHLQADMPNVVLLYAINIPQ